MMDGIAFVISSLVVNAYVLDIVARVDSEILLPSPLQRGYILHLLQAPPLM
jgi:hypothetical protein